MSLSLLGTVDVTLVSGIVRACYSCREWSLSLLSLGAFVGALSSEAVVGGFRRKRSSVLSSVVNRK